MNNDPDARGAIGRVDGSHCRLFRLLAGEREGANQSKRRRNRQDFDTRIHFSTTRICFAPNGCTLAVTETSSPVFLSSTPRK